MDSRNQIRRLPADGAPRGRAGALLHQETATTGPTASRPSSPLRSRIKATSFLLDGEAVIPRADGMPDFNALRSQSRDHEAMLHAFDLLAARWRRTCAACR